MSNFAPKPNSTSQQILEELTFEDFGVSTAATTGCSGESGVTSSIYGKKICKNDRKRYGLQNVEYTKRILVSVCDFCWAAPKVVQFLGNPDSTGGNSGEVVGKHPRPSLQLYVKKQLVGNFNRKKAKNSQWMWIEGL